MKKIVIDAIRSLLSLIDTGIYSLIEGLFQLIIDLANVRIFNDSVISDFAGRIYVILGLIMVFKLMISFIQLIVNPEKMDDKEQGVANILKRVIFSIVLIVLVPLIFDLARTVQDYVVPVIPKVLLGRSSANENSELVMADAGRVMAFRTYLAFFDYDNPACNDGSINEAASIYGDDILIFNVSTAHEHILDTDDTCSTDEQGYKYRYTLIAPTFVGGYLIFTLVSIAVYIAIRALKLSICEFIAPIPIASYIDPKTSKQAFDSWVKITIQTYLDLFISLIGVYFIAFVLKTLFENPETLTAMYGKLGGSVKRGTFVTIFIIIGLLKFAKEFPKFVTNLLGFKEGSGILGDVLKMAGGLASATGGAIVGGAGNIIAGKGVGNRLTSGVAGFASGLFHGGKEAILGNKNAKEIYSSTVRGIGSRRNQRAADRAAGIGPLDRARVAMQDYFQINDDVSLAEGTQKSISNVRDRYSSVKSTINEKISRNPNEISWNGAADGSSKTVQDFQRLLYENMEAIESSGNVALKKYLEAAVDRDQAGRITGMSANFSEKIRNSFGGRNLTFNDLNAVGQMASQDPQLGTIAVALTGADSWLRAEAQKEIQSDTFQGNTTDAYGNKFVKFMNDSDVQRTSQQLNQVIAQEFGNIGAFDFSVEGLDEPIHITSAQDLMNAYKVYPSEVDKALNDKIKASAQSVAGNKNSAARASNQRRRGNGNGS